MIAWINHCYIIAPSVFLPPTRWQSLAYVWIPSSKHAGHRAAGVTRPVWGPGRQLNGEVSLQMDLDESKSKSWPGGKFLRRGNYTQKGFDNSFFKAYSIWKKIFSGQNQPLWKLEKCIKKTLKRKKRMKRKWLESWCFREDPRWKTFLNCP